MNEETAPARPHISFLFSDTGGGHRSAAEAVIEALRLEFGDSVSTEMVDIFKSYAPPPLHLMPDWYPYMVRVPELWELGFRISNSRYRTKLIIDSLWPYVRHSAKSLVTQHPSDLIVSVHPIANMPVLRAMKKSKRPPYIVIVTDLVTTHAFWYHPEADLTIVPTEDARQKALHFGLSPDKVKVIGLPVADRFCHPTEDRKALREQLGWPQDLPLILLVGGGEGMGPLEETAWAIASAGLSLCLVVVTGRNQKLKARLEAQQWPVPTFIYGFVHQMPEFMQAADILVTKAGPGTISEAFIAGLPLILYSRLPGQEDGNVTYVTEHGAGIWAPRADLIVNAVRQWLLHPESHAQAAAACRRLARPQASRQIAHILMQYLNQEAVSGTLLIPELLR